MLLGLAPWLQSCSHPGVPVPSRDFAFRPLQASQPECASSAAFPAGARVPPAAAAVLPGTASPGSGTVLATTWRRSPGRVANGIGNISNRVTVSASRPGCAPRATFPARACWRACRAPDSALCWPTSNTVRGWALTPQVWFHLDASSRLAASAVAGPSERARPRTPVSAPIRSLLNAKAATRLHAS